MTYTIELNKFPKHLSGLRILISNDDGIHAQGLRVMEEIAKQISQDVWVVAPETEHSGAGHSLSINRPLRFRELGPKRYAVDGTPTDCVMMAIKHIMGEKRPHLLLSGVNYGMNIAEDVTYSGTVAAAMEGTLLGIPSIAMSMGVQAAVEPHWETAKRFGPEIIRKLTTFAWAKGVLMNVNVPDLPPEQIQGVMPAAQGFHDMGDDGLTRIQDPYGRAFFWLHIIRSQETYPAGTDLHYFYENNITISPLHLDLTHMGSLSKLQALFCDAPLA